MRLVVFAHTPLQGHGSISQIRRQLDRQGKDGGPLKIRFGSGGCLFTGSRAGLNLPLKVTDTGFLGLITALQSEGLAQKRTERAIRAG